MHKLKSTQELPKACEADLPGANFVTWARRGARKKSACCSSHTCWTVVLEAGGVSRPACPIIASGTGAALGAMVTCKMPRMGAFSHFVDLRLPHLGTFFCPWNVLSYCLCLDLSQLWQLEHQDGLIWGGGACLRTFSIWIPVRGPGGGIISSLPS